MVPTLLYSEVVRYGVCNVRYKIVCNNTSKTPAGRQATEGRFTERSVERSKERPVERLVSGWSIYSSPQTLIPSPIDSARRVTSIPRVSVSNSQPTPTMMAAFYRACQRASGGRRPTVPETLSGTLPGTLSGWWVSGVSWTLKLGGST